METEIQPIASCLSNCSVDNSDIKEIVWEHVAIFSIVWKHAKHFQIVWRHWKHIPVVWRKALKQACKISAVVEKVYEKYVASYAK